MIWRLGKDGDFQTISTDPNPWFSYQHDAGFLPDDNSTLMVFENGNTRRVTDPNAHSRGQVIHLDEANRVATFVLNADLGAYSLALGTAQALEDRNYSFDSGWILGDQGQSATAQMVEVDSSGRITYNLQAATQVYRTFRVRDLPVIPGADVSGCRDFTVARILSLAVGRYRISEKGSGLSSAFEMLETSSGSA